MKKTVASFAGMVASVEPSNVPPGHASALLNVDTETGALTFRRGFRTVKAGITGATRLGFARFVAGYDSNQNPLATFLAGIEDPAMYGGAAPTKPSYWVYEIDPNGGARNRVEVGGTPVVVGPGNYDVASLDGVAYVYGPAGVFKHQVGDLASWGALDADRPGQPTTPPALRYEGDVASYTHNWGGGAITTAGTPGSLAPNASTSSDAQATRVLDNPYGDGTYYAGAFQYWVPLASAWDVSGCQSFTIRFSNVASVPDPTHSGHNADIYAIHPTIGIGNVAPRMRVYIKRTGGSVQELNVDIQTVRSVGVREWDLVLTWPDGVDKTTFIDVVAFRFDHQLDHIDYQGNRQINPAARIQWTIGTIGYVPVGLVTAGDLKRFKVGVGAYDSARDAESKDLAVTDWQYIKNTAYYQSNATALGNTLKVTPLRDAGATVTDNRVYVMFEDDGIWRYVDKVTNDGSGTVKIKASEIGLHNLTERNSPDVEKVGTPICAGSYKGSMVWGYARGKQNLRFSGVGNPARLYRAATDLTSDSLRGGDYSLSDNFQDEPRVVLASDNIVWVLGRDYVYTMIGDAPYAMQPPKRIGNARGVLGKAATIYMSPAGLSAVIWIGTDQECYMVDAQAVGAGDFSQSVQELTKPIRGLIRSFLTQTDSPDPQKLAVAVDWRQDSLWLVYANRALVYRRPSLLDDQRPWQRYQYAGSGWVRMADSGQYGLTVFRSDGTMDELEHDRSANFAPIVGTNRDGGNAAVQGYWTSAEDLETRRRWAKVTVHRKDRTQPVDIAVASFDRSWFTTSKTVPAGVEQVRLPRGNVGERHKLTIYMTETTDTIERVEMEVWPASPLSHV